MPDPGTDDEQHRTRQPNRGKDRRPTTATVHDDFEDHDRIYLEKLQLAEDILQLGEDSIILGSLETELWIFRDRGERALLQSPESLATAPRRKSSYVEA